jgi:hypothetical protein
MSKIVKDSYKTGEAGVILFNQYCNQHNPFIIFREVTKHDFGIDGELELTRKNEDGKIEATAEILKVQIKSVNSANSYMKNENDQKFDFYADPDDLEYWLKHQKYNLQVLLIIIDLRTDSIYVKKITDLEIYSSQKKGRKLPIQFNKIQNKLEFSKNNFVEHFSASFKSRIDFDTEETLITNSLLVKRYPRVLYVYKSKLKKKKEIFEKITSNDAPHFVIKSNNVYLFREITRQECPVFYREVLTEDKSEAIHFTKIIEDIDLTNIFLELFHEHLKHDLYQKLLNFSKDYHRFYFRLKDTDDILEVSTRTRKRDDETSKKVVTNYKYGKIEFFRHYAVELKIKIIDESIWIIVNPKYLFTKDRKETLPPKQITKFTNYLTAREYNNEYANHLHFWKTYLFKGAQEWVIFANEKTNIIIGDYNQIQVPFGIARDVKSMKMKKENLIDDLQQTIEFDEN